MANLPPGGELEFMIKIYPDGKFSSLLSDGGLQEGDELEVTGPYGVFTLREKSDRPLLFIGGGAGMAPILALLRSMAEQGIDATRRLLLRRARATRPVSPRRAGRARASGCRTSASCRRCRTATRSDGWSGERGLITDVVARCETELGEVDAYLCGPPPMVDAAIAMLDAERRPRVAGLLRQVHDDRALSAERREASDGNRH